MRTVDGGDAVTMDSRDLESVSAKRAGRGTSVNMTSVSEADCQTTRSQKAEGPQTAPQPGWMKLSCPVLSPPLQNPSHRSVSSVPLWPGVCPALGVSVSPASRATAPSASQSRVSIPPPNTVYRGGGGAGGGGGGDRTTASLTQTRENPTLCVNT